tara:strand:+ start:43204 stop:45951 length:2748 start_codon:yes stop_codon:yes gene_type:complete
MQGHDDSGRGGTRGDLLIPPGSYAYFQSTQNGSISTKVGPTNVPSSGNENPIKFDPQSRRFTSCTPDQAMQTTIRAGENDYIILENPCLQGGELVFPGTNKDKLPENGLEMGRRVVVHGPVSFALWPGQVATVVEGHALRTNEYLELRVYDAEAAKKNWSEASVVAASATTDTGGQGGGQGGSGGEDDQNAGSADATSADKAGAAVVSGEVPDLRVGQRLIIKGTDVSFYMPPSGIQVVSSDGDRTYVRSAVSLELLEYTILVDESGDKRFVQGPAVVFPEPTETFFTKNDTRKFRAIELQEQAGLHLKALKDFTDEGGKQRKAGDEYFVTGKERPIYYPREEEAIVPYAEGERVHYAVAVPKGEGRYVMEKDSGEIDTRTGPEMLLCDPTDEVIVRRILTDRQCEDWYPGNDAARRYNASLRSIQEAAGSARSDVVSDSVTRRAATKGVSSLRSIARRGEGLESLAYAAAGEESFGAAEEAGSAVLEEFERRGNFTQPKSITLDTKFEGVPTIELWTGYAVMVVNKSGDRRIEVGPTTLLLDYDESLEIMELSTGKPKSTDTLLRTVYLRVQNNKVSDVIEVETSDHVRVKVKVSFRVNFAESNPNNAEDKTDYKTRWFATENYVKLLCDHVRSVLKGEVKKHSISEFYATATATIRDILLGKRAEGTGRPGMFFDENGMHVVDVEVLATDIEDREISALLIGAQREAVESNIKVAAAKRQLETTTSMEDMARQEATAREATKKHAHDLQLAEFQRDLTRSLDRIRSELETHQSNKEVIEARIANGDIEAQAELVREKARHDQLIEQKKAEQEIELAKLKAEVDAVKERFGALDDSNLPEMLAVLSREDMLTRIATASSWQTVIGGQSLDDALGGIFGPDSPVAKMLATLKAGSSIAPAVIGSSRTAARAGSED